MFHYFRDNYGWSLSVQMALSMGGEISEIEDICAPLRPLAAKGDDHALAWFASWRSKASVLERLADGDLAAGNKLTASRKYLRSALYLFIAERQGVMKTQETQDAYARAVGLFKQGVELGDRPVDFVEVPFGDESMPAILVPAQDSTGDPCPAMVHFGGLDVNKELIYLWRAYELADRGVSVLIVDHPGLGESVRFRELYATYDIERSGTASFDFLATRHDIDDSRIGIVAPSLGGYYAPRVAAFEPRFACCVLWGAIWSVPELFAWLDQQERPAMSVPLEEQFRFVMGLDSIEQTVEELKKWELADVMGRVRCPMLVAHGANDQQAPPFLAQKTYDAAVNSSRRELRFFSLEEGGAEHCSIDVSSIGTDYLWDWTANVLNALGSAARIGDV